MLKYESVSFKMSFVKSMQETKSEMYIPSETVNH